MHKVKTSYAKLVYYTLQRPGLFWKNVEHIASNVASRSNLVEVTCVQWLLFYLFIIKSYSKYKN